MKKKEVPNLIKEFCAENFTDIPKAIAAGATRIELCDNLAAGGTTVSTGVMEETIHYCHEKDIPVMAIIRPRGGNFVYHDTELKIMETDLLEAKALGVDGIVIGVLNNDNSLDKESMARFIALAEGLQITFHMAFDQMSHEQQLDAIDWLAEQEVTRILTHGGLAGTPISDHYEYLKSLVAYANNRIIILPGGGVTYENCDEVMETLNVNEVHGTRIVNY